MAKTQRRKGKKRPTDFGLAPLKKEGGVVFPSEVWDGLREKYPRLNENTLSGILGIVGDFYRREEEQREFEQRNTRAPTGAEVLGEVAHLINGDRAKQHGDKVTNHLNIANLWNAFLATKFDQWFPEGLPSSVNLFFTPHDVVQMMILLKVARTQSGDYNIDDMRDAAGYAAIAIDIANRAGR